jgi:Leu/Phe-tRNA-protein transferase
VIEPALLVQAYRQGIFPMALEDDEIGWFSPDPRGILPLIILKNHKKLSSTLHHIAIRKNKLKENLFVEEILEIHNQLIFCANLYVQKKIYQTYPKSHAQANQQIYKFQQLMKQFQKIKN